MVFFPKIRRSIPIRHQSKFLDSTDLVFPHKIVVIFGKYVQIPEIILKIVVNIFIFLFLLLMK